ncbi:MAG TPA: hypothetical protein VHN81_01025 [Edaphobacter sp.]|nr:hypothetical protein [Acidobacteriota bacterium]HEX2917069.1 hypothetical protein [Edaphobacter sp.]
MTPIVNGFSISAQRAVGYQEAFPYLCDELRRHGFEILSELRVGPALEHELGLSWAHLGLPWQNYTVLVVWSPPDACQAVLSDRDGGLLAPFNICVVGNSQCTVAAVINYYSALISRDGPIGIRLVIRNLTRRIYEVLQEFANEDRAFIRNEVEVDEVHMA